MSTATTLRFTPYAWAKLVWFRDRGRTEIGGFGITSEKDPLLITDFQTVKQEVSVATVEFDDDAVADYFDDQIEAGLQPFEFCRIWLHTHPGTSPNPSTVDEATFKRVFSKCDWAVMLIIAEGGNTYTRLSYRTGPHVDLTLKTEIDYWMDFPASDRKAWEVEYKKNIDIIKLVSKVKPYIYTGKNGIYPRTVPYIPPVQARDEDGVLLWDEDVDDFDYDQWVDSYRGDDAAMEAEEMREEIKAVFEEAESTQEKESTNV